MIGDNIMAKRLDLHGILHEDVDRLVENFALLNNPPLEIICGNSSMMVGIVLKVLDKHNIDWERWDYGTIKIL